MNFGLIDRVVIVTGAAGAVGSVMARQLLGQGARVALVDRVPDALRSEFGERAALHNAWIADATDLTDPAAVARMVDGTLQAFGRIDGLVNIAGGYRAGAAVHEMTLSDWDLMFAINVRSALLASRAVVPHFLRQGSGAIVNVGSRAALAGVGDAGAYSAAKAVVVRLTESMSAELKDRGVRINAVLPSIVDTEANRAAMPGADFGRWVEPEALAAVILFLLSDGARAIHGAAIPVFGRA
jgi:NAD(P)-dependent dehydrogenase (short-subunit alcohol dehydrogenase family)